MHTLIIFIDTDRQTDIYKHIQTQKYTFIYVFPSIKFFNWLYPYKEFIFYKYGSQGDGDQ